RSVRPALADALPAAFVERGLFEAALMKLPVKELVLVLVALAGQRGLHADRVQLFRSLGPGQIRRRGQPVGKRPRITRVRPRPHRARPPGDEWHADAAVRQAALDARERPGGVEAGEVMPALIVRPVVTGENNQRVFRQALL